MLKIQAGQYKKQRIYKPKSARALQAKLRQHLFGYLGDFVQDAQVLDLFAGAGTFGIEALSRGASQVVFVEKNPGAIRKINQNLEILNLTNKGIVIKSDVITFLNTYARKNNNTTKYFNIIFMDPPYKKLLNMTVEHQERYIRQLLFKSFLLLAKQSILILKIHNKVPVTLMEDMALLETHELGINKLYYLVRPKNVKNKEIQKTLVLGNSKFTKVGGRQKKKIRKGIKKRNLSENMLYDIEETF